MDRIKSIFAPAKATEEEYEPLTDDSGTLEGSVYDEDEEESFSWLEYSIFAVIGVAMLWAWNMFLAAAPYFQTRFESDEFLMQTSQSAIISVSTISNLVAMYILTNIQSSANYAFRINTALFLNVGIFGLLAVSTSYFVDISPSSYLAFLLVMVGLSALACGLMQNGAFAYAASFGRPEYTQAIMAGQGVAGILPPLAQMLSFLAVPPPTVDPEASPGGSPPAEAGKAAFIYFMAAVLVSAAAIFAFVPLTRRHDRLIERRMAQQLAESVTSIEEAERAARRFVSIPTLFRKLHWVAASVFMCFVVTMFFPVFTAKILSVRDGGGEADTTPPRLFAPGAFIPLGFFFWNLGDLLGRMSTILPFSLRHRPSALFAISIARVLFLPLYLLCNIRGRGAVVNSDLFYLLLVELPFGLTNGWLASNAMMAAGEWVADSEREAAGSFMGMCLVAGLTVGSLLSFTVAGI
ncbi:nucleoside transporter-domain-containing protein [Lasiosphaeria miniovina]|uniref:Nucleoside transporter-domain-containing protein n=1 Tax=Lasiosphaeria miniovina TaxID=1954250 RepID=A0AA40E0G9_9PEZI|nr:nucleoside transporter-domain-containing protein [Lasiosphaeria miniovina]KAK0722465.1 nucleoside transporter-domain-containing protein [Lasiosphaeria miniovina]